MQRDSTNITISQYSYDIINLLCKDFIARLVHLSKIREIQSTIRKLTFQQAWLSLNVINLFTQEAKAFVQWCLAIQRKRLDSVSEHQYINTTLGSRGITSIFATK